MINKSAELKRLGIFLFLSFVLTWVPWIILNKCIGYTEWFESGHYNILVFAALFGPALANVITRKLTKEGWKDSKLHLRLKGNIKYYIVALLLPTVISIISGLQVTLTYGHFDWSEIMGDGSLKLLVGQILSILTSAPLFTFMTFGEEFGWRAYMNQKMEPVLGVVGTCVIGGAIWGVWHAPLTVNGHNFGVDYPGFPYVGILLMSLICIFESSILMWLTKKTDSVFPAAIYHSMNNNGGALIGNILICGVPDDLELSLLGELYLLLPQLIFGIIFLALIVRDRKKKLQSNEE